MGEPATIQTATSTQEFEVHVNPLRKYPVDVYPRNVKCQAEKCWWKKQAGSKAFRFTGFTAHPHGEYETTPFVLETLKITDDEIECEFDGSVAPPDTKFEYTIQAEFTDVYTSDKPEQLAQAVPMSAGDDKAVIRN